MKKTKKIKKMFELRRYPATQEYVIGLIEAAQSEEIQKLFSLSAKDVGDKYDAQYLKGAITGFMTAIFVTHDCEEDSK